MMIESWPESMRAWERAKGSLGGGMSSGARAQMRPHPIFFTRGQGSRLFDVDGHEYVDYVLGWGPVILGHAHPRLVEAVGRQLSLGQTFGSGHPLEYEVAERVCAAVPGAERVLWSNTGSEAVQIALRLARAVTGRRRFIKFVGPYHGWTDPMLIGYRPGSGDALISRGQHPRVAEDVELLPWNDVSSVRSALGAGEYAAVFCEPVLCNGGVLPPADGFLAALREACDASKTVLVFDEVITGFRIAYGGAAARYGVRPDLIVLAKAIAGGFPLAAVAGDADIIDAVTRGVVHAGTYNGNPVVLAAAAATLDELATPGVYEEFERLAARLVAGFAETLARHGIRATVHNIGPIVQCVPGAGSVSTIGEYHAGDWNWYDNRLTVELLRRGVFNLPGGRWYLSTAHTEADVDRTVEAFDGAVGAAI